jgi:hypothetical protein
MDNVRNLGRLVVVIAALLVPLVVSAGQFSSTSPNDLASLEQRVADARAQLQTVGARTGVGAPGDVSALETELDAIADDVAYLRVKTRRGESVSDKDRREVADRLSRFETRLAGQASDSGRPTEIPVGTELDIRLLTPLSSDTAQVEQRVDATTLVDLMRGGQVVIPAGSAVRGYVVSVDKASRTDRRGGLVLQFTQLTANGRSHAVTLSVTQALESEGIRGEAAKIGIGAGVGAILGGILGGGKGALAGILIGGGGTILATEGKDVELPAGTVLRVRFDAPLDVGTSW